MPPQSPTACSAPQCHGARGNRSGLGAARAHAGSAALARLSGLDDGRLRHARGSFHGHDSWMAQARAGARSGSGIRAACFAIHRSIQSRFARVHSIVCSRPVSQRRLGFEAELAAGLVGRPEALPGMVPVARRSQGDRCGIVGQLVDQLPQARGSVVSTPLARLYTCPASPLMAHAISPAAMSST